MNITAEITGIKYKIYLAEELKQIDLQDFDINKCPSSCLVIDGQSSFALSKWVSPKRSRTYPYERVYNTLDIAKKITVIPVVKDEGGPGDRDYLQWDTVSLMSLLDVYVIFTYYHMAERSARNPNKITRQQFDNKLILEKIKEISSYHSSALHWNLKELNADFSKLIDSAKTSYQAISQKTGVVLHGLDRLDFLKERIATDINHFMEASRVKARFAQMREHKTIQPKEVLRSGMKATLTIKNYLGGWYYLTVDEAWLEGDTIFLVEGKHGKKDLLPAKNDMKDGLLKMMLFCNLTIVSVEDKIFKPQPVLSLTSIRLNGILISTDTEEKQTQYFSANKFKDAEKRRMQVLFKEAAENGFLVMLQNATL